MLLSVGGATYIGQCEVIVHICLPCINRETSELSSTKNMLHVILVILFTVVGGMVSVELRVPATGSSSVSASIPRASIAAVS